MFSFFSLEGAINVKALSKDIIGSPKRAHKSYLEQKKEEEVEKLMLKIKKAEKMEIAIKQQKMKKNFDEEFQIARLLSYSSKRLNDAIQREI